MKIISINIGQPKMLLYGAKEFATGGDKHAVASAVLGRLNFEGDGQADLANHGGPDKTVCVYEAGLYPHWESVLGHPLTHGAFSENLTIKGATDDTMCIGEALAQVSQPRQSCGKVAARNGDKQFVKKVQAKGTGFYLRVLQEGVVYNGDAFERTQSHPARNHHRHD